MGVNMSVFNNVPLNGLKQFVMGVTKDGCEVYMPVASTHEDKLLAAKNRLQFELDRQPGYMPPTAMA